MEQRDDAPRKIEVAPTSAYPNDPSVPDVFADGLGVQLNYSAVSLVFTRVMKDPPIASPVAVVRISPQQALLISHVLRGMVATYEKQFGTIHIPDELAAALGVSEA